MEAQEVNNNQNKAPADIGALEKEMKEAFKADDFDGVKKLYDQINKIDTENRVAAKIMQKVEKAKEEKKEKEKKEKVREYVEMLKKLYKEKNVEKVSALVKEFKEYDPENKHAIKWEKKAVKLREKINGKVEERPEEAKTMKIGMDSAPKQKVPAPEKEKKSGILGGLFAKSRDGKAEDEKKEEAKSTTASATTPAPIAPAPALKPTPPAAKPVKPITPAAPIKPATTPNTKLTHPTPSAPVAPSPAPKADKPKEAKGNLFTDMFEKKEDEASKKSIIDTIVAKTDKDEAAKGAEKEVKEVKENETEKGKAAGLLTFSKVFMNFAIIFIVFSAIFLYVEWIDKENTVLGLTGISENTGSKLHAVTEVVEELKEEEDELNKDIELFKEGYDDEAVKTVDKIMEERINWPEIFNDIKEVTNSVYELNDFFKYVEYNNYSFDAKNNSISVGGKLSDPLGRNLTKLVELEEAFMNYPRDIDNPEDTTEPYFKDFKEFSSFSKTLDSETGRYTSSFQLSFNLNK